MKKIKWIILAAVVVILAVVVFIFVTRKDYSKHTFEYMDDFTWDMTMDEAVEYIETHSVQPWRDIKVDGATVTDGFYFFDFSEGKLWRVRFDMGGDPNIVSTLNEWFGTYDKHTDSKYGNFGYYYWYGMMAGKKTEALLYMPSDTVFLHFTLEE